MQPAPPSITPVENGPAELQFASNPKHSYVSAVQIQQLPDTVLR